MNYKSFRMSANAIDLQTIEIIVNKEYYNGLIETFYLREQEILIPLQIEIMEEREQECIYRIIYPFSIEKVYDIVDNYGLAVVLQYTMLVSMPDFDTIFFYQYDDLGTTYKKENTTWKVWAPTALSMMLSLHNKEQTISYCMQKEASGIFSICLEGDYHNAVYTYLVNHDGSYQEVLDPYSHGSLSNAKGSVVIDTDVCVTNQYTSALATLHSPSDISVYELHIRDFTSDPTINCSYPGTYLGMVESGLKTTEGNKAGIDYLVALGITHVQIMPMYDFSTVEENYSSLFYNWGYDPIQYNVPEASFSTNPKNPYTTISECQQMISEFHKRGIRVVMDVVYNHMYDVKQTAYETLVPGYFFRRHDNGELSNGSWCGNEVNTSAKMIRKYLVDISLRWQTLYGIDGLRFDLMGLIDTTTLQEIYDACSQHNADFIMYGEGWNMDTPLSYEHRGIQENHHQIPVIGFFNDYFRDQLKGKSDAHSLFDKGYFAGNLYNTNDVCHCLKNVRYTKVTQSINYVECHDNATIYDKYCISNQEESEKLRKQRQKLLTMTTILAQGIPFLHAGQECYRTKKGIENAYNNTTGINTFDWALVDKYQADITEIRDIMHLRKTYRSFWYNTNEEVQQHIVTNNHNHQMVEYVLHNEEEKFSIYIYINGSTCIQKISIPGTFELLYCSTNAKITNTIPPITICILKQYKNNLNHI